MWIISMQRDRQGVWVHAASGTCLQVSSRGFFISEPFNIEIGGTDTVGDWEVDRLGFSVCSSCTAILKFIRNHFALYLSSCSRKLAKLSNPTLSSVCSSMATTI